MGSRLVRHTTITLLAAATVATGSCTYVPRDSHGALDQVRGGVVRVGVVENPPWTVIDDDTVSGIEPQLLEAWASLMRARVEWRPGGLDELADALHRREIDVLAGGLRHNTPYAAKLALTQPYTELEDPQGKTRRLVLAVTPGESALLFALDQFLAARDRGTPP
jgi:hypothetical protein